MRHFDKVRMGAKIHRVRKYMSLVTTCGKYIDQERHQATDEKVDCKSCLKDWNVETDDKYK